MDYFSTKDTAKRWGVSERSVRNYCAVGRVNGAVLVDGAWLIPSMATLPKRKNGGRNLLQTLKEEMNAGVKGGIYHKVQVDLTYSSNHIEGSTLTHEQTRFIYETNTAYADTVLNVDDLVETANHFRAIDFVIKNATNQLSESLIKELHFILKNGTSDSRKSWFNVGEYKKLPNEVGGRQTTKPEEVSTKIKELLCLYNALENKTFEDVVALHYSFERIHPFQDGNGRIGRLIMFKECLKLNFVPFIIDEGLKYYYYRGLNEWERERGYLIETCLSAQDKFKTYLDYFNVKY